MIGVFEPRIEKNSNRGWGGEKREQTAERREWAVVPEERRRNDWGPANSFWESGMIYVRDGHEKTSWCALAWMRLPDGDEFPWQGLT